MKNDTAGYDLFFKFIEAYAPLGYKGIDANDPLVEELERLTQKNNQFFHVADLIQAKILWASNRSHLMIGIKPEELTAYHFMEATHPDDLYKHGLGRSKMFSFANDLFAAEKGTDLLSINIRIRNLYGEFQDLLFQLYFFFSKIPYKSVFLLQVHTNIDMYEKRKHGYHYYVGNDMSNFRYPDKELLSLGIPFTDREFEIIKLISLGMQSNKIAEKMFLSLHTVNTHRKNILTKAGKETMSELIVELINQGLL